MKKFLQKLTFFNFSSLRKRFPLTLIFIFFSWAFAMLFTGLANNVFVLDATYKNEVSYQMSKLILWMILNSMLTAALEFALELHRKGGKKISLYLGYGMRSLL